MSNQEWLTETIQKLGSETKATAAKRRSAVKDRLCQKAQVENIIMDMIVKGKTTKEIEAFLKEQKGGLGDK